MKIAAFLTSATLLVTGSAIAAETNIWSIDFETGVSGVVGPFSSTSQNLVYPGAVVHSADRIPGFGDFYLWNNTGNKTTFSVDGLDTHTALRLKFDLVFQDSWDSLDGGSSVAPDILYVDFDGHSFEWTVNNASGTIFDVGPGTVVSTGTDLVGSASWPETVVSYDFLFSHVEDDFELSIRFGGAGFQGGDDESWGIDNFSLSAIHDDDGTSDIPAPASLGLLLAGLGLTGTSLRRRQRQDQRAATRG